jgi:folate-binding protein YgfZ
MPLTPLQIALRAGGSAVQPAVLADYRGATTAARFGDPQDEFSALLTGCGTYDLGFRVRIQVTGSDRVRWLNGMITNNIRDLAVGHGVYAFLLNPQGHILGDMHVFNSGDALLVETDRNQVDQIASTFDHYIIMDDVDLKNLGESETAIGVAGPKARQVINAIGIEVPEIATLQVITPKCTCDCDCVKCTVIRGEDTPQEIYEIWFNAKDALKTWQTLIAAGAAPVGSEALELQRIVSGVPLYGVDIRGRELPQETGQMRALNFNKGCYIGQEIVERIRSRGNVHRRFAGFVTDASSKITAGEKILFGGKEVGGLTSAAVLRTEHGERSVALGYVRREAGLPGTQVLIADATATVVSLPMQMGSSQGAEDLIAENSLHS